MSIELDISDKKREIMDNPHSPISIISLSKQQIADELEILGVEKRQIKMRTNQIWNWLYVHGVKDFSLMNNIAKNLREKLKAHFFINRPELVSEQISNDGTRKWLFRFFDRLSPKAAPIEIETVFIPEKNRGTLCISSQVGCTLNCSFCHTGTQKLVRNLTSDEIIAQLLMAKDLLNDYPNLAGAENNERRAITNIVMMGMGEPLYNYDNVKRALLTISDGDGLAVSKRRITLSTSGVVPKIAKVGEETGVMLAISLHAVRDDLRNKLVPINKKWPIAELLNACKNYPGLSNARRITFEYVMLKGVNDSDEDAKELVRLLKNIPSKINLIPFNPWPNSPYQCSDWERIERFGEIVNRAGYASPIRMPRGRDIDAACGQLKSDSERIKRKI